MASLINRSYLQASSARLATDLGTLPAVWASEGKLSQVFLNLLINAAQAFEGDDLQRNEIRIRTWAEGEDVFAEVTRQEDVSETVSHIVDVVRTW